MIPSHSAPQPPSPTAAPSGAAPAMKGADSAVATHTCSTHPAMTVEQQLTQIRKKLAEHTIGSDNNTHRTNNPIWEEEKP